MKTWSFISLRKFRKLQHLLCFFWFSVTKQSFKNVFGFPQWSEIPTLPASLKIKRHFSMVLRLVILYFLKWKILSDDWRLYLHDSKWNSRSDVAGLTHTKQLLNLLCIIYLDQWFWRRCLNILLIYSSGGSFVWRSRTICAILVEGIMGNIPMKLF